jgi:hypothetical protein
LLKAASESALMAWRAVAGLLEDVPVVEHPLASTIVEAAIAVKIERACMGVLILVATALIEATRDRRGRLPSLDTHRSKTACACLCFNEPMSWRDLLGGTMRVARLDADVRD